MPNNDIKYTINPEKKVSYEDIKKIVEDEPNYKVEHNNIKNKSKKLLNKKSKKEVIDYSHFKIKNFNNRIINIFLLLNI